MPYSGNYTDEEALIRLMGEEYFDLVQSDLYDSGQDDEMVVDTIDEAESIIDMHLSFTYAELDLRSSTWVRRKATWIAAYLLSRRRGNPGNFMDGYMDAIDYLERVKEGEFQIPGIPRSEGVPAVGQTLIVDNRFRSNKLRVDQSYSTEKTGDNPFYDPFQLYEWF